MGTEEVVNAPIVKEDEVVAPVETIGKSKEVIDASIVVEETYDCEDEDDDDDVDKPEDKEVQAVAETVAETVAVDVVVESKEENKKASAVPEPEPIEEKVIETKEVAEVPVVK